MEYNSSLSKYQPGDIIQNLKFPREIYEVIHYEWMQEPYWYFLRNFPYVSSSFSILGHVIYHDKLDIENNYKKIGEVPPLVESVQYSLNNSEKIYDSSGSVCIEIFK